MRWRFFFRRKEFFTEVTCKSLQKLELNVSFYGMKKSIFTATGSDKRFLREVKWIDSCSIFLCGFKDFLHDSVKIIFRSLNNMSSLRLLRGSSFLYILILLDLCSTWRISGENTLRAANAYNIIRSNTNDICYIVIYSP